MSEGIPVIAWSELDDESPVAARVLDVDLVVIRIGDAVHVLHSRCPHRGANLADGTVEAGCIVCSEHGWDFCCATGESPALGGERVHRFESWVDGDQVFVAADALRSFSSDHDNEPSYTL